jgi:sugar O-acyltransferase (sialic acid O-acetyltransferase NeuD family)
MILIGTGAQAKYVMDIIRSLNRYCSGLVVYNLPGYDNNKIFYNVEVCKFNIDKIEEYNEVVICSKDSYLKERIYLQLQNKCINYSSMIHSRAYVSDYATVSDGTIINANAVIQPEAKVGSFCMIHSGVIVEHNCVLEDFVNLAPGVILGGAVKVGKHTVINSGSIIAKNITIGKGCIIGAGSLVLEDIPDNVLAYGHPIEPNKYKERARGPI